MKVIIIGKEDFMSITYLIYIILFETLIFGGCSYIVFWKGFSGWWFLLAVFMSSAVYSPEKWSYLYKHQLKIGERNGRKSNRTIL